MVDMPNILEIPAYPPMVPSDPNALIVWAGTSGPTYGGLDAFQAATKSKAVFPADDWMDAIEAATRKADEARIPTVYVVRNA